MHAKRPSPLRPWSPRAGLPLASTARAAIAALPALVAFASLSGCGRSDPQPPIRAIDASAGPVAPVRVNLWEGKLPPIPEGVSPRFEPLATLVTQRIDRASAPRRIADLALAAAKEMTEIPNVEIRATQLASLCNTVGPNVEPGVVDPIAQAAFDATGKVTQLLRLQNAYEDLAHCLAHASAAKRTSLLTALLTRAAESQEISVFTWPFRSASAALGQLAPAEVEPLLGLAERLLPRAQEAFHKEHLLSGMAAAGIALPPERALGLLARAEAGVAGPAFADSRAVFLAELAQSWIGLAKRQPALFERAAQALLRLEMTPYDRAAALGRLVALPGFAGAPQALAVLKRIAAELPKLPAAEKAYLLQRLLTQAAKMDGAKDMLQTLVAAAEPDRSYRAHVAAVRGLAGKQPAEALRYAEAAVGLLDKMTPGPQRTWRYTTLARALSGVDAQARAPFIAQLEKRAAAMTDRTFAAQTLLKLLELAQGKQPEEALRLQEALMRAVDAIPGDAHRLRVLQAIHALGLPSGPAAAEAVIAKAIPLTATGASGRVWWRFIQAVQKQPAEAQRRWLPRLLPILVDHASTWRPEELASRARLVGRLAPTVMPPAQAEALILRVWRAVERAPRRSAEVETEHVVTALRAIGVALAAMGSTHFPVLVRRLESRIPRRKTFSEPLMSQVTSLGCLLSPADGAGLQKRLEAWVALGTEQTHVIRRGAIVAGMVACHGILDPVTIRAWQAKGPAELSWDPMVQFLIRLPLADLQAKAALLPERRQRIRMYRTLIDATIERGTRELSRWRGSRDRARRPEERR